MGGLGLAACAVAALSAPMPALARSVPRHLGAFAAARRDASTGASRRPAKYSTIYSSQRILPLERPPDPSSYSGNGDINEVSYVQSQARLLRDWMKGKRSIVCLTGAGMSTESGIPDYRGSNGSYFRGHKPIIHHEFMTSLSQRKRYWSRSLVGYSPFANAQPNLGHLALAQLEALGAIGVDLEECTSFDQLGDGCFGDLDVLGGGGRSVSVITQNVDTLHTKAGLKHCLHLHGRGDLVRCMNCDATLDRKDYHDQLAQWNQNWLTSSEQEGRKETELRPDGDAELGASVSYDDLILPPCPRCGDHHTHDDTIQMNGTISGGDQSIIKTDVVFFGDSVPKHRFDISYAAIDAADGVLCIGE